MVDFGSFTECEAIDIAYRNQEEKFSIELVHFKGTTNFRGLIENVLFEENKIYKFYFPEYYMENIEDFVITFYKKNKIVKPQIIYACSKKSFFVRFNKKITITAIHFYQSIMSKPI